MSRSSKVSRHLSLRLADDTAPWIDTEAKLTGWSDARTINMCIRIAQAALARDSKRLHEVCQGVAAAIFEQVERQKSAERIAAFKRGETIDPDQLMLEQVFMDEEAGQAIDADTGRLDEAPSKAEVHAAVAANRKARRKSSARRLKKTTPKK